LAVIDSAGTMASSSGRATAAPTPRRNVRRGIAIFVTNITDLLVVLLREEVELWRGWPV
jgi:hypothetical protein